MLVAMSIARTNEGRMAHSSKTVPSFSLLLMSPLGVLLYLDAKSDIISPMHIKKYSTREKRLRVGPANPKKMQVAPGYTVKSIMRHNPLTCRR